MNQDETRDPNPESESAASTATVEETTPPPEPMTPEKVSAWNRYLDRFYIATGVFLLVILASLHPIAHSSLWPLLKSGELISSRGPVTTDPFSYTEEGKTWVNVPWLFELVNWQIYNAAQKPFANDPARAEQIAAGVLGTVHAILLGIAAGLMMGIRRRGPGLWWAALCVMIALGGFFVPLGAGRIEPAVGGISWRNDPVSPQTWGILLFALELLLLHRAVNLGRRGSLYALPVVFLFWANVDESFFFGLLILAAWTLGALIRPPSRKPLAGDEGHAPLTWPLGLGIVIGCAAVCLVNPSIHRVYPEALEPYAKMVSILGGRENRILTADQLTFFDARSQAHFDRDYGSGMAAMQVGYYLTLVCLGAMSFALNRRRFALGRFLAFVVAALLWAGMVRLAPFFSLVFAAILTLNGQEWFHDVFGTEGRVGVGWKLWSDGMRAATILAIFGFLTLAITGFVGIRYGSLGLGVERAKFAFEAADYLRDSGIKGRVLNLMLAYGDAMIWRDPVHKTYIDNRPGVFPEDVRVALEDFRTAIAKGNEEGWRPLVEKYGVTAVMVSPVQDPRVFSGLLDSPSWVPFYDDGTAVLFGLVDDDNPDVALYTETRLDPDSLVYKRSEPLPDPARTPSPVNWMNMVLRDRETKGIDPHVLAAERWLMGRYAQATAGDQKVVEPAQCLMAIRQARAAINRDPDDPYAYEMLQKAYYLLSQAEFVIISQGSNPGGAGTTGGSTIQFRSDQSPRRLSALTPSAPLPGAEPRINVADAFSSLQGAFLSELLSGGPAAEASTPIDTSSASALDVFRFRQRVSALNFAIQTTPPPRDLAGRGQLAELNATLAQLYLGNRMFDLARDRLQTAHSLVGDELADELLQQLAQLGEQVEVFRTRLEDQAAAQPIGPFERANVAITNGFPGIAIEILRNAETEGLNPAQAKPILMDLYCQIGQPDEAFNLLEGTTPNDPTLATGPGTAAYRQGLISLLLGYYQQALYYWDGVNVSAIPDIRGQLTGQGLGAARSLLMGDPAAATRGVIDVAGMPGSRGLVQTQAQWEAELGLALLELGLPQDIVEKGELRKRGAVSYFRKALELDPDMAIRPLLVYYLEKLGGEVPPPRKPTGEAPPPAAEAKPETDPGKDAAEPAPKDAKEAAPAAPAAPSAETSPAEKSESTPAEPKEESTPKSGV